MALRTRHDCERDIEAARLDYLAAELAKDEPNIKSAEQRMNAYLEEFPHIPKQRGDS